VRDESGEKMFKLVDRVVIDESGDSSFHFVREMSFSFNFHLISIFSIPNFFKNDAQYNFVLIILQMFYGYGFTELQKII
jgi:hypothetical protein